MSHYFLGAYILPGKLELFVAHRNQIWWGYGWMVFLEHSILHAWDSKHNPQGIFQFDIFYVFSIQKSVVVSAGILPLVLVVKKNRGNTIVSIVLEPFMAKTHGDLFWNWHWNVCFKILFFFFHLSFKTINTVLFQHIAHSEWLQFSWTLLSCYPVSIEQSIFRDDW